MGTQDSPSFYGWGDLNTFVRLNGWGIDAEHFVNYHKNKDNSHNIGVVQGQRPMMLGF